MYSCENEEEMCESVTEAFPCSFSFFRQRTDMENSQTVSLEAIRIERPKGAQMKVLLIVC